MNCIRDADHSAAALVNLLADTFPCFRDETLFNGRMVRLYKRAQILVADVWACFNGESYGEFHDIDKITMFAGMLLSVWLAILYTYIVRKKEGLVPADLFSKRLPGPSNAASARLSVVLAASGVPHPTAEAAPERVDLGGRAARHQHLVR